MDPLAGVVFGLIAVGVLVAVVVQAVRYFRNSGDRTDVFGPPRDQSDAQRDEDLP